MTTSLRAPAAAVVSGAGFIAQAARFVAVGTSGMVLYLGAYAALAMVLPAVAANIFAWLVSTVVCNAAHRRVTFGVTAPETARADAAIGLGTSLIGLAISSVAISMTAAASSPMQFIALVGGTAIGGAARFVLMRWWLARSSAQIGPSDALAAAGAEVGIGSVAQSDLARRNEEYSWDSSAPSPARCLPRRLSSAGLTNYKTPKRWRRSHAHS